MSSGVLFERRGPVAHVVLDRPDKGNTIDIPMARRLMEIAIACDEDPHIRCVLLTGNGRLFCAGGDVAAFSGAGDDLPAFLKEITAYLHSAIARLIRMEKPLVTAVNGPAAGAGVGLAILGDIVLADPSAHFTLAYTAIGMSPDAGASWLLPRLVGLRIAQELCLRNRRVKGPEAAEIGLITRVVAEGTLAQEAGDVARELARGAVKALGATRRLLLESFSNSIETHMEQESRAIAGQARTLEGKEGIAAFIAKRTPDFLQEK